MLAYLDPTAIKIGDFQVQWYAITMLTGAILTYLFCDYLFKKEGYFRDYASNLLLICFPAGIIGARLWYVIAEWNEFAGRSFFQMIDISQGGLAIQGGVIVGLGAGLIYTKYWHPEIKLLKAIDVVIPNILVAQIIGRWGNFMNKEVFGDCISPSDISFLPNFIVEQMTGQNVPFNMYRNGLSIDPIASACGVGQAAQPLFLYEGLINLVGFILISFVLRKYWTKWRFDGDLGALYFLWYGVVRLSLEPLRNPEFIMDGFLNIPSSIFMSILFIIAGVAWLAINRGYYYYQKKRKHEVEEKN